MSQVWSQSLTSENENCESVQIHERNSFKRHCNRNGDDQTNSDSSIELIGVKNHIAYHSAIHPLLTETHMTTRS